MHLDVQVHLHDVIHANKMQSVLTQAKIYASDHENHLEVSQVHNLRCCGCDNKPFIMLINFQDSDWTCEIT